ncbi:MAG: GNAT family N-acetyltransferase [Minisyncoccota bacterium]
MNAFLTEPSPALARSFQEAVEEQGLHMSNEEISDYITHSADASLGLRLSLGEVPRTEYWLQENGKYLGRIQIRKTPSGRFPDIASHVYYEIRPSEKGKGYGTAILALGLGKARDLNMSSLVVACDAANVASRKIIEHNGGVLTKTVPVSDSSTPTLLYTIEL